MHKTEFLKLLRECRDLSRGATQQQKYKILTVLSNAHKMIVEQEHKQKSTNLKAPIIQEDPDYLQEK